MAYRCAANRFAVLAMDNSDDAQSARHTRRKSGSACQGVDETKQCTAAAQAAAFEALLETDAADMSMMECPVCMDDFPGKALVQLSCGCRACYSCMREHVKVSMAGSQEPWPFRCPACVVDMTQRDVQASLGKSRKLFKRVLNHSIRRYAQRQWVADRSVVTCPFSHCNYIGFLAPRPTAWAARRKKRNRRARQCVQACPGCQWQFCCTCGSAAPSGSCAKCTGVSHAPRRPAAYCRNEVRGCPTCGAPSLKVSGCPRVSCPSCTTCWDWDAGQKYGALHPDEQRVFRGRRRTKWEWCRAGMLLLATAGLCWVGHNRYQASDHIIAALAAVDALFMATETFSRGTKLVSSHTSVVGIFTGFSLGLHCITQMVALPVLGVVNPWLCSFLPAWKWLDTAQWLASFSAWAVGEGLAWSAVGLCGFVILFDWATWARQLWWKARQKVLSPVMRLCARLVGA